MAPPTGQRAFLGAFLLISYNVGTCIAWLAVQRQPSLAPGPFSSRILMSAADENDGDGELDDRERMKTIRALQDAFYSSGSKEDEASPACRVEPDGSIASLPLWRPSWTELPGRSNVLIVHEARYTHMFEQVIRNGQMLFGHLRLPGGSNSIGKEGYELLSYKDEADIMLASQSDEDGNEGSEAEYCYTDDVQEHSSCRSACVGTLMKIVDYRRMGDGKLLLLVHALDRFVVSKPVQELPFSIADVQLLPDSEEMEYVLAQQQKGEARDKVWYSALDGSDVLKARRTATSNAWRWQQYEYDDAVKLPVRSDGSDDLTPADVVGTALKSVVPHVPFASSTVPSNLLSTVCAEDKSENANGNDSKSSSYQNPLDSLPMEKLLIDSGILLGPSEPDPSRKRSSFTIEQLERELWIFVNEWVQVNNAMSSFPPELLALLPPCDTYEWPDDFILEDLATTMAATSELKGSRPFVRITEDYPAHRRRRRLSYVISALTDHTPFGRGMPPILLEIHSTRDRLEAVLDVFEFVNTEKMGEFN